MHCPYKIYASVCPTTLGMARFTENENSLFGNQPVTGLGRYEKEKWSL